METMKIREDASLARLSSSGAILNTDNDQLHKYRQEREKNLRINKVIEDTKNLKNDVDDIKNMLSKILEKIDGR